MKETSNPTISVPKQTKKNKKIGFSSINILQTVIFNDANISLLIKEFNINNFYLIKGNFLVIFSTFNHIKAKMSIEDFKSNSLYQVLIMHY